MNSRFSKLFCLGCFMALVWAPMTDAYGQAFHRSRSRGENYHFGFVYGSVGYNSLQTSLTNVVPSGAVGGSLGAGYEFRYKGLWVSLGIGAQFHRSALTLNEYGETHPGFDTQGKEVIFHYDILSQKDQNEWTMVDIPLMIGYYVKGFYFGVGPKLSLPAKASVVSEGEYDFSAYYPMYDKIFHDMPGAPYYYTQYKFKGSGTITMNPLASICAELGYDVLSSVGTRSALCTLLKIGGYFEYGLNSVVRPSSTAMYLNIDPQQAQVAQPTAYFAGMTEPKRVVPFYAGLKITLMIGGSRSGGGTYHKGCMCYQQ